MGKNFENNSGKYFAKKFGKKILKKNWEKNLGKIFRKKIREKILKKNSGKYFEKLGKNFEKKIHEKIKFMNSIMNRSWTESSWLHEQIFARDCLSLSGGQDGWAY